MELLHRATIIASRIEALGSTAGDRKLDAGERLIPGRKGTFADIAFATNMPAAARAGVKPVNCRLACRDRSKRLTDRPHVRAFTGFQATTAAHYRTFYKPHQNFEL